MGLIYDSGESDWVKSALSGNLATASSALDATERASTRLVAALGTGELSGEAYTAVDGLFAQVVMPSLSDAKRELGAIQSDLDRYTNADANVSRYGVLKEAELNIQLTATKIQRDATERFIAANTAAANAVIAVPGLSDAVRAVNSGLEMVLNQLENDLRELEDRLRALREFDAATRGLFQSSLTGSSATTKSTVLMALADPQRDAKYLTDLLKGMTPHERAAYLASGTFREWASNHWESAKLAMDEAADTGLIPPKAIGYARFLSDYWNHKALIKAGIDLDMWNINLGTEANWETIKKVYDYYGRLYLDHPELQWAGMANLIGPSFAGGFRDLAMFRDILDTVGFVPGLPPAVWNLVKQFSDEELRFFETTLLGMQKEIFLDQARQHEAFLGGGMKEIERLLAAGEIDQETATAWARIASGDPAQIAEGNRYLLKREQKEIIDDNYDEMRNHPVTGEAMTQMITLIGAASIPGAKPFPEVFPGGNIADKDDRWALIDKDTLPAYQDLLRNHPDTVRDIIESDFTKRTEDMRITNRLPEVVDRLGRGFTGKEKP